MSRWLDAGDQEEQDCFRHAGSPHCFPAGVWWPLLSTCAKQVGFIEVPVPCQHSANKGAHSLVRRQEHIIFWVNKQMLAGDRILTFSVLDVKSGKKPNQTKQKTDGTSEGRI